MNNKRKKIEGKRVLENKDFVDRVLTMLNPLEREIINKRYLSDEKTQTEVSNEMNILPQVSEPILIYPISIL